MANQLITLVFTDVVGSSAAKRDADLGTSVSVRDKAYLEAIQAKHLRLVRSAVAEHKGKEIMTIGDSFFLTFDEPLDALRCCAAIQQRLADQPIDTPHGPLRLRIGIHVGTPEFFEGSWHGTDVDIAARAQSAASPRQIVVTHATRQLLGEPIGIKFRPLGTFALKGVGNVKLWDADYDYHGLRPAALKSIEQRRATRRLIIAFNTVMILFALACAWWEYGPKHGPDTAAPSIAAPANPAAVNSIIVADFDNKTGEPVFDATLTQAFTIQLEQSPVLSVVSPQHLRASMKFLGKSPDDPLTPAIAQDIGVREGDKAYVTGEVAKLGNSYLITVNAINPSDGSTIASAQSQAADKDHVLDALSAVSTQMRSKLGESLESIQKLDTPLGLGTTPSLDAFREFALGDVDHCAGREIPLAEEHYKQALAIDPNFAVAWARLGTVYSNNGQIGKSLECYKKAFDLSKNASDRERWYIETKYYGYVVGDVEKTIDIMEAAAQTYPLESGLRLNLGIAKASIGRVDESLADIQAALKLAPDNALVQQAYLLGLIGFDRYAEAQSMADAWSRDHPLYDSFQLALCYLHTLTDDAAGVAKEAAAMAGHDDEFQMTSTLAVCQEFQGRYAAASDSWKRAATQAAAQGAPDAHAGFILARITGRALAGYPENFGPDLQAALALDRSKPTLQEAATAAAVCNLPTVAQPIIDGLAHDYPQDTIINQIILPGCRAMLDVSAHQPQAAIDTLNGLDGFDAVSNLPYILGLAYLQLHDGPHAVDAFRRATRYRGGTLITGLQDYGQAQLGLARAYTMTGDTASAKKAYEALFATWKNADADLPQLVAAKKEYAALK